MVFIPVISEGDPKGLALEASKNPSGNSYPESHLGYAIITTADLSSGFEDLVRWRSKTGYNTEIFLLDGPSGIIANSHGSDDAEKLLNFLDQLLDRSNGTLEYILLGGDDDKVPVRYLHANATRWNYDDGYLSDVYYSSPGIEWDMDSDGRYGEREDLERFGIENISFPLKVGRFPVSNLDEVRIMVDRVIEYESNPEPGTWLNRGVLASSLMEAPNIINNPHTPVDEGFDSYKDNGYKAFLNYTYRFLPRSLDLVEFHDYTEYEGGNYSNITDGFDIGDLPSAIDDGCSFFTFAGQSFYDIDSDWDPPIAYSLAQYMDPNGLSSGGEAFAEAFTYEDAWNLTNGNKLPVAYISSCDSANFSSPGDTSLENIVRAPEGGAICLIGSTGVSWRGEGTDYSLGNWYLLSIFWQRMVSTGRPGDSLYRLKNNYLEDKWDEYATKEVLLIELYTYNLLGDPALSAWMGSPVNISLTGQISDTYAGGDTYTARITDSVGNPLSMVKVAVYMNSTGEVFTGLTGPDGEVQVETNFRSGGPIVITATGRSLVPVSIQGNVLDQPLDISIGNDSINIFPMPLTEGEAATLQATIINNGPRKAFDVQIFLMEGNIPEDPEQWPDHIANSSVDLLPGSQNIVEFEVMPSRSWKILSVGIIAAEKEIVLSNNVAGLSVVVNARPRFLPIGIFEMFEDQAGGGSFDLAEMVYDPDNDPSNLIFSLGTGSPSWCVVNGTDLEIMPPNNWSGTFDLTARVSDGLASDITDITVLIDSVNDPPVIMELEDHYTARIDSPFSLVLDVFDAEGEAIDIDLQTDLDRLKVNGRTLGFVPYSEDEGNHSVALVITDSSGANRSYEFNLEITKASGRLYFSEPSIHLPRAKVGSEYSITIDIGGDLADNAVFSDDSDLFDIDPDSGEIKFKPQEEGEHWIIIRAASENTTIERNFYLEITGDDRNDPTIYWILGAVILLLLILVVGAIMWNGPPVQQYGIEE
jgi:hypothetical protein